MSELVKWPSMHRHDHDKQIDRALRDTPELVEAEYTVTEKLHGCNVQIRVSRDGAVSFGSRKQYVEGSALFGWPANLPQVIPAANDLIAEMDYIACDWQCDIILYGELIGPGVPGGKTIDYGENKRVVFYSVGTVGSDGLASFNPYLFSRSLFPMVSWVPYVSAVSGLRKALEVDTRFETLEGPPSAALRETPNLCEGVVISPATMVLWDYLGPNPFMVKKKNPEFEEVEPQPREKTEAQLSAERVRDRVYDYVTPARVASVYSKHGQIETPKQIGHYIKLVLQDVRDDFENGPDAAMLDGFDEAQKRTAFNVGSKIAAILKEDL